LTLRSFLQAWLPQTAIYPRHRRVSNRLV